MVAGRGFVAFSDGQTDVLTAFDLATGRELWRAAVGATYRGHGGSEDGPLSTPVVAAGKVFLLNAHGKLFAFDAAAGSQLWSRDLPAELGAVAPHWGFATTPLPVGGTLVVQAGGAESNGLVALDAATGATVWSSQPAKETGYSSPILATLAGVRQIVGATNDGIFGLKPEDGSILWSLSRTGEPRQSPVPLPGDRILLVNWDEAAMFRVKAEGGAWQVAELWRKPVLKSTLSPALYRDGYLYGMNGLYLVCVDAENGEVKWRQKLYGGTLMMVDGHLAAVGEVSGSFHLIAAAPEGFHEELKAAVFTPGARSLTGAVYASGRFLLRNGEEMVLLELSPGKTQDPGSRGQ